MVNAAWTRWLLLAACLLPLPALAAVEVSIDRNPVQVNESFQLVFWLDRSPDRDPDFSPLQEDFLILGNNRSNSISIINGEYQRSAKWSLQLMAREEGEFTIPAIRFDKESSEPVKVTVQPSTLDSVPGDELALELEVNRPRAYVQSQVILTLRLFSRSNISAYQFGDISLGDLDTVVEPLGDVRQYQTRIGDRAYLVLEKQVAVFPQQSGRLAISPVLAEVRLRSQSAFDPFIGGGEIRRVRSQPAYVDVEPIPVQFDAAYWLPATRVELRDEWPADLGHLVAGEPITRTLTLQAEGLTAAQLPELALPAIDGIKQYPDQPVLHNQQGSDGISGQRVQKIALIPGSAGSYFVPEVNLQWWNLKTGKLETATLPARELIVAAAPQLATGSEGATTPAPAVPVTAAPGRFWFWLSLLLACGWGLQLLYGWLQARRRRVEPAQSEQAAQTSLRQARKALQQVCETGDSAAARPALLAWGRALLAPRRVDNLHQLGVCLGSDLSHQIDVLNQCLYAPRQTPWQGEELWRLCQQLEQGIRHSGHGPQAGLLPLNPAN